MGWSNEKLWPNFQWMKFNGNSIPDFYFRTKWRDYWRCLEKPNTISKLWMTFVWYAFGPSLGPWISSPGSSVNSACPSVHQGTTGQGRHWEEQTGIPVQLFSNISRMLPDKKHPHGNGWVHFSWTTSSCKADSNCGRDSARCGKRGERSHLQ